MNKDKWEILKEWVESLPIDDSLDIIPECIYNDYGDAGIKKKAILEKMKELEGVENKKVTINLVKGSDGYSLQIINKNGNGYRYAGPKAWGNPYNEPTASFEVELEDFIKCLKENSYELGEVEDGV